MGAEIFLAGILPTLEQSDLAVANMAPVPRYAILADTLRRLRGEDFQLFIKGRDELTLRHGNVMLEAANTSFQFHLQVHPSQFARIYNIAQVATAPALAVGTFSPLFLGRRLWSETRIAVFTQAVDTRRGNIHQRVQRPRVHFGESWVDESVMEIFRQDISAFRVLLTTELGEDPLAALDAGRIPDLKALRLHNGTVYRWNRACYGILNGVPHLRIENRVLPAGPSVVDEIANSAFWLGLVLALDKEAIDVRRHLRFDEAHDNFLAAARTGLKAQITWLDGRDWAVGDLVLQELAPRARQGLKDAGLEAAEIDRYLGTIEERVARPAERLDLDDRVAGRPRQGGQRGRAARRPGAVRARAAEGRQAGAHLAARHPAARAQRLAALLRRGRQPDDHRAGHGVAGRGARAGRLPDGLAAGPPHPGRRREPPPGRHDLPPPAAAPPGPASQPPAGGGPRGDDRRGGQRDARAPRASRRSA